MNARHVVFIADDLPWLRIENDAVVARGDHFVASGGDAALIAVAPAAEVALYWADLPDLAPAQARGAARLIGIENSLIPADQIFVACGEQDDPDRPRVIATTTNNAVARWIEMLDPDVIIPSPLLLLEQDGFVRANFGHETVLRGPRYGFADDDVVAPLITGDAPVITLDRTAIEVSIIATTANPEINLRQGMFARKIDWSIDQGWLRKVAIMMGVLGLITLAIPLIQIVRLSWITATLTQTSASLAQAALGEAVPAEEAAAALDARLASLRGGGAGFVATTGAVSQAIKATANTELTAMSFAADGTLRITVRGASAAEIEAAQARMRGAGLQVIPGTLNPSQGQPTAELQVRGQ